MSGVSVSVDGGFLGEAFYALEKFALFHGVWEYFYYLWIMYINNI